MKFSRRDAITTGVAAAGGFVGTIIAGCNSPGTGVSNTLPSSHGGATTGGTSLAMAPNHSRESAISTSITNQIQRIIGAQGMRSNGVFSIEIDRNDITDVMLRGVHVLPSFELNGSMYWQSLGDGRVMMNGDMCLKRSEMLPFIDRLIAGNITFQAEHQHFYDFIPIVFFQHFRAAGDPIQIARAMKSALNTTSTPFPQTLPTNPTTPLPAARIGKIIGATPSISSDGVVNLNVPRANPIVLGGVQVNPYLNIATAISFQPLSGGMAAAVSDYGMLASEVQKVVALMRSRGWDSGCLYNQETDEFPQLYFDHTFKTGDPLELAREIRAGLDLTNSDFLSPDRVGKPQPV